MSSEISIVAADFRLQEWAAQIRQCRNRLAGMSVVGWCALQKCNLSNHNWGGVKEYGFSKAVWQLCPEGFKKPLGDDWEDVLSLILWKWSPEIYLLKERKLKSIYLLYSEKERVVSKISREQGCAYG